MDAIVETCPVGHSLNFNQVEKLCNVLSTPVDIHPPNNFPSLSITPAGLVKVVQQRLVKKQVKLRDIRLNGSAASFCLSEDNEDLPQIQFNDIDLIFGVDVDCEDDFHVIKEEVLMSLLEFFPSDVSKTNISCPLLEETYVRTMVLVSNSQNQWSLISLGRISRTTSVSNSSLCTISGESLSSLSTLFRSSLIRTSILVSVLITALWLFPKHFSRLYKPCPFTTTSKRQ